MKKLKIALVMVSFFALTGFTKEVNQAEKYQSIQETRTLPSNDVTSPVISFKQSKDIVLIEGSKLNLADYEQYVSRFFVRVKGEPEEGAAQIRALFGNVEFCQAEDVTGEYAFITEPMKTGDFDERKGQLEGFISRIFINGSNA